MLVQGMGTIIRRRWIWCGVFWAVLCLRLHWNTAARLNDAVFQKKADVDRKALMLLYLATEGMILDSSVGRKISARRSLPQGKEKKRMDNRSLHQCRGEFHRVSSWLWEHADAGALPYCSDQRIVPSWFRWNDYAQWPSGADDSWQLYELLWRSQKEFLLGNPLSADGNGMPPPCLWLRGLAFWRSNLRFFLYTG